MIELQQLQWSGVFPMTPDNQHLVPDATGVYRIRIVDGQGMPVPILRQGGMWDKDGLMYVGATTRSGTLRGRFYKQYRAHADGMRGKIEKNGEEQDLVQLWRDIRAVHPSAGLTFQFAVLTDHLTADLMEARLHAEYVVKFGEKPCSGKVSLLHNRQHPWREYLGRQAST